MLQSMNYLNPQMYPNYGFQTGMAQPPYIERFPQNQQNQQNQQTQQAFPQQVPQAQTAFNGLNGRIVDDFCTISANDVPMDATGAVFIKRDGSEIQWRMWNANGTIATTSYKPIQSVSDIQTGNVTSIDEKRKFDLSDASTEAFMQRFDDINEKLEKIEKSFVKTSAPKSRKEVDE